eukprot:1024385-Prymnesium_polylepis.2
MLRCTSRSARARAACGACAGYEPSCSFTVHSAARVSARCDGCGRDASDLDEPTLCTHGTPRCTRHEALIGMTTRVARARGICAWRVCAAHGSRGRRAPRPRASRTKQQRTEAPPVDCPARQACATSVTAVRNQSDRVAHACGCACERRTLFISRRMCLRVARLRAHMLGVCVTMWGACFR